MGKYTSMSRKREVPRDPGVNPVMRGIGCIFIALVPPLAYGVSALLIPILVNNGVPIPPNWLGTPQFHPLLWRLSGLAVVLNFLSAQTNLVANLIFTVAISIVVGGIMSIIFGYIYKMFGPSRYGPLDVPPPRIKVKRYKR